MSSDLSVVILAAGQGTRMRSALPKVLHAVGGKPMLQHVIEAARGLSAREIHVVYGHGGEMVRSALASQPVQWVEQAEQLGTGHAVSQAMPAIPDHHTVMVLYGDVPLITVETLRRLAEIAKQGLGLLTTHLPEPQGYGRIVRDETGRVLSIVEEKDATEAQRRIQEVNTGMLATGAARLRRWLDSLDNDNAQGEYYLTDVIARAVQEGVTVETTHPGAVAEVMGVNNRVQLAALERDYQRRRSEALMLAGVTLLDPERFDLRGELEAGQDVVIDVNVVIEGRVSLGDGVYVGPNCYLRDVTVARGTRINSHCVLEQAEIGAECRIGPFARVRPETQLADRVHIGNFVEIKKSQVAEGSKVNHLSYVGDSTVGRGVNIGAGVITCNYDGANKHRTVIGDDAFIGSDSQLVAPVEIGAGATIGAGSTITRDTPAGELTLARAKQKTVQGWSRPVKKRE